MMLVGFILIFAYLDAVCMDSRFQEVESGLIIEIRGKRVEFIDISPGNKRVTPRISPEFYPSATSRAIIRLKPTAKSNTPMLECSPADISGISSSTTT